MCQKNSKWGHSFSKDFVLRVDSKSGPRETRIELCKHCGLIRQSHLRDFALSLLAIGVFFTINKTI